MDPFTQGILGASLSTASTKKNKQIKIAAFCGMIGGIVPDFDIFIRSANDSLLSIEYHRHFSHSLFFVPIIGFFISFILYFILRKRINFKQILIYTSLGVLSHGLLDSLTSYGTSILWPFSKERIAWNFISIVDPVFTFILLIFLTFCLLFKSKKFINVGLTFSLIYLFVCIYQQYRVKNFIINNASKRGHEIERILIKPTIGNNILWRSIYQNKEHYVIDAVYQPFFSKAKIFEGMTEKVIDTETIFPKLKLNSKQREDIRRFSHFSNQYIYVHPDFDNVIADLRYSKFPYDNKSLWGIQIDFDNQNNHVEFLNLREFTKKDFKKFWQLLNGIYEVDESKKYDIQTYAGPMGMGLAKSYKLSKKKFCIYNTINGQDKLILDNVDDECPKELE